MATAAKSGAENIAGASKLRRRKPELQANQRVATDEGATESDDGPDADDDDDDDYDGNNHEAGEELKRTTTRFEPKSPQKRVDDEDAYSPWLDVLRVLAFLFFASCGLSYLISSGESFFWGMRDPPNYLRVDWWKSQLRGPVYLTPLELAAYDGRDASRPIYLAINGTVYDVSASQRVYGPGGSYNVFAGLDASRGFVTGCFVEDRTPDMRGVEDMFLPLEEAGVDYSRYWTAAELAELRAREREEALQKVHDALLHWVNFFKDHKKYSFVGYVKREDGWLDMEPRRKLCDQAAMGRQPRKLPGEETK